MIHHRDIVGKVSGRDMLLGTCTELAARSGLPLLVLRGAAVIAACVWFKLAIAIYCGGAIAFRLRR